MKMKVFGRDCRKVCVQLLFGQGRNLGKIAVYVVKAFSVT